MPRPYNDPRLIEIAKTFGSLPEFPDAAEFGEHLRNHDGESFRHYSILPGGKILGVRFFIKGRNRFVAYAPLNRQLDLLRFADMATMRLWKFMSRSKYRSIADSDLNFPVSLVQRDLDDFETDRPDIIALLDAIQSHFLELGIIRDQSVPLDPAVDPRKQSRKTVRSEFMTCHRAQMDAADQRHQELLDAISALHERLDEMAKRLPAQWDPTHYKGSTDLTEAQRKQVSLIEISEPVGCIVPGTEVESPGTPLWLPTVDEGSK